VRQRVSLRAIAFFGEFQCFILDSISISLRYIPICSIQHTCARSARSASQRTIQHARRCSGARTHHTLHVPRAHSRLTTVYSYCIVYTHMTHDSSTHLASQLFTYSFAMQHVHIPAASAATWRTRTPTHPASFFTGLTLTCRIRGHFTVCSQSSECALLF
jgi:hypothetical protein